MDPARVARDAPGQLVFFIERSTNANVVAYYTGEGDALCATWLMYAKQQQPSRNAPPTEALTAMEESVAYGFDVRDGGGGMEPPKLRLRAVPARTFTLQFTHGRFVAMTEAGDEVVSVFVQMKRGLLPRVDYVQLRFADGRTEQISR